MLLVIVISEGGILGLVVEDFNLDVGGRILEGDILSADTVSLPFLLV